MPDNLIVPRYQRLQSALTGTPLEHRTRNEMETIAADLRLEVAGSGKGGYVTADDLRDAIRGASVPRTTARATAPAAPATTTEGVDSDAD